MIIKLCIFMFQICLEELKYNRLYLETHTDTHTHTYTYMYAIPINEKGRHGFEGEWGRAFKRVQTQL